MWSSQVKLSSTRAFKVSLVLCIPVIAGFLNGCQWGERWKQSAQRADSAFNEHQYPKCQKEIEQALIDLGPDRQASKERFNLLLLSGDSYTQDGKFDQAAGAYQQALTLGETLFGPTSVNLYAPLNGLRGATFREHKYDLAEGFSRRMLSIQEKAYGPEDARVEPALSAVIGASCIAGKCSDETELLQRLLKIRTKMLGPNHKHTFVARQLLAEAYAHRRKYDDALLLYEANLESAKHADAALVPGALINLARVEQSQHHFAQAEQKLQQALVLQQLTTNKSATAGTLVALADVYKDAGKIDESIRTYKQALDLTDEIPHKDNSILSKYLQGYADALTKAGKQTQAAKVQKKIDRIAAESEDGKARQDKQSI